MSKEGDVREQGDICGDGRCSEVQEKRKGSRLQLRSLVFSPKQEPWSEEGRGIFSRNPTHFLLD